ncbi:MAG: TlpA family protein disulfide reductase [Sphingobacteriales bacterium]|nr:MAG: TlpA family protein disulfide reductase [Sphingobacteriales bacterium]
MARLLLIGFSNLTQKYNDVLQYLGTAVHSSENTNYFDALRKLKKSLESGQLAYPFVLQDSSGKFIELAHLKGKVVVMDLWFTGCMACKVLAKQMRPIVKHFETKKVAFVSVSVDSSKTTWLNSVKKGHYTHPGTIDVYTNGLGYGHPILKHYNINSYPRMIIIDPEGRLISTTPPRPMDDKHSKSLIKLIETNLPENLIDH